jgi:hypothetical protein
MQFVVAQTVFRSPLLAVVYPYMPMGCCSPTSICLHHFKIQHTVLLSWQDRKAVKVFSTR